MYSNSACRAPARVRKRTPKTHSTWTGRSRIARRRLPPLCFRRTALAGSAARRSLQPVVLDARAARATADRLLFPLIPVGRRNPGRSLGQRASRSASTAWPRRQRRFVGEQGGCLGYEPGAPKRMIVSICGARQAGRRTGRDILTGTQAYSGWKASSGWASGASPLQ